MSCIIVPVEGYIMYPKPNTKALNKSPCKCEGEI